MRRSEILLEFDAKMTSEKLGKAIFDKIRGQPPERVIVRNARLEYGVPPNVAFLEDSDKRALELRYREGAVKFVSGFDPTPNKAYSRWMCQRFADGGIQRLDDLPKTNQYLNQFHNLKTSGYFRRTPENAHLADIGRFKTLSDLGEFLLARSAEDAVSKAAQDRNLQIKLIQTGEARLLLDTERFRVISPTTVEAATVFGRNTQWCTTSENGTQFDYYNEQGPLYIILDKPANKRWQFHFETKSFMDENDRSIYNYGESDFQRWSKPDAWKREKTFNNFPPEFWDVLPGEMFIRGFDVVPTSRWDIVEPSMLDRIGDSFVLIKIALRAPEAISGMAVAKLPPTALAALLGYVNLHSLTKHEAVRKQIEDAVSKSTVRVHTQTIGQYEVTEGNLTHVMMDNFKRFGGCDMWRWIGRAESFKQGIAFLTRFPSAICVVGRTKTYFFYRAASYEVYYVVIDEDGMFDEHVHGNSHSQLGTTVYSLQNYAALSPNDRPRCPEAVARIVSDILDPPLKTSS